MHFVGIILTVFGTLIASCQSSSKDVMEVKLLKVMSSGYHLKDGSCCIPHSTSQPYLCLETCRLAISVCPLPECRNSRIQLTSEKRSEKAAIDHWQGRRKFLVQVNHLTSDISSSHLNNQHLMTSFYLDYQPSLNSNWSFHDLQDKDVHLLLEIRITPCAPGIESTLCEDRLLLKKLQVKPEQFETMDKRTLMMHRELPPSERGFLDWFASLIGMFTGFSSRISNIVNLLDVMRRILSYMF